VSPWWEAGD